MIQSKHQSPSKLDAVVDSESLDRISGLPDKLLCHILAFLPTRSAVATTVLSKRWNLVWINVPVLDFTELPSPMINSDKADIIFNKEQYISFKDYVNRILLLNGAPCIERVHFEIYEGFARSHLKEWILVLARRYVQEFFLTSKHLVVELSSSFLLAKEKLVVLNLEGYIELSLPSSVHLPCLQYLSLTNIMFVDEHDPLTSILSGCPVLETLNIDRCKGPEKFSVSSSSVKTLRILSVNHKKEAILIKAPNLEVLHLSIGIKQSVMDDLPSLVEARLDIWTSSVRWIKLLQRICNTKTLVLYRIILDGSSALIKMPTFQNLTCLEVGLTAWSIVLQILRHAPNLASFIIHKLMFDWPDIKPERKGLRLERIEYYSFDVDEGFKVVTYFLRSSMLLKEFKIYTRKSLDSVTENDILKVLLKVPRASNQCEITVVNEDFNCQSEDSDIELESDSESEYADSSSDD
ncbi:F-box/LRR-repeat protein At3g26922-like [Chenopodium quinoa]|uniref:F-box/LRR-repeat protein At3g26922-like n=1 Tax=Chenopodium quinoa TaxID=63459 RepID=UPI000B78BD4A|nr:F-box/LRR-repeat protein At3g26922-like [Chenopodium quinoa]